MWADSHSAVELNYHSLISRFCSVFYQNLRDLNLRWAGKVSQSPNWVIGSVQIHTNFYLLPLLLYQQAPWKLLLQCAELQKTFIKRKKWSSGDDNVISQRNTNWATHSGKCSVEREVQSRFLHFHEHHRRCGRRYVHCETEAQSPRIRFQLRVAIQKLLLWQTNAWKAVSPVNLLNVLGHFNPPDGDRERAGLYFSLL